jgi:hypothetical protein
MKYCPSEFVGEQNVFKYSSIMEGKYGLIITLMVPVCTYVVVVLFFLNTAFPVLYVIAI